MGNHWSLLARTCSVLVLGAFTCAAQVDVTQLASHGWYADDVRADGEGSQPAGTNLKSPVLTDLPESGSGSPLHEADIFRQLSFGTAPGAVPAGTWPSALRLLVGNSGSGKSQISHRKDDLTGHGPGSLIGPGFTAQYSWMADSANPGVTGALKIGFKTADFGMTPVSTRTGENAWDKLLIYEPSNGNGGSADGLWHTESPTFTTGNWWLVDRTVGANTQSSFMTLSALSTSGVIVSGAKTLAMEYALITAPGARITSVQFGIGSGSANGSVYINQFRSSAYLGNETVRFGSLALQCDQNVTSNFINGTGTANGGFTTARVAGIELGLRGKLRFNALNMAEDTFNSNGDGTYTFQAGHPTGGAGYVTPNTPRWNIDWSINTNYNGSTGLTVDDLTYELRMDFDATPGVNTLAFDPIGPNTLLPYTSPVTVPFWDHSFGTNATPQGGGTEAATAPAYAALLASSNLVQNSWNMEFFNEAPFNGFDPDVPGRYDFSLAAFQAGNEVARTHITIIVVPAQAFEQNVTSNFINGSGVANGAFTTGRADGVEIGLRGKLRFNAMNQAENTFHSNGDGTYTFDAGHPTGGAGYVTPNTPRWNVDWSINTSHDGSTSRTVDDLTYRLSMDFDGSAATQDLVFDPIGPDTLLPFTVPQTMSFWDHSFGNNGTASGAGVEAGNLSAYLGFLSTFNLVQNSWNMEFFNEAPFNGFNPDVPGRYDFSLAALSGGNEISRSAITVVVTNGTSLLLEAAPRQRDQDCGLPGAQIRVELHARNLGSPVSGYQAFLAFDPGKLTYVGTASSYSAAPFPTHVQPIGSANVGFGQLRLDGVNFASSTQADSLLATLVFTASSECTSSAVSFDLTQPFDSELSFLGTPVPTALVDAPSIVADATPPVLGPTADITTTADASLAGGCTGRVVSFASPVATDGCSAATVQCFPPSGSTFPEGTTTVSCVATDTAGNETVHTFDVTVTATNVVTLSVQLAGVNVATTRCIRFQTNTCAFTDVSLPFDSSGLFAGDIEIPCGSYAMLCAKDRQHTQWASVPLSISGTQYVATGTLTLDGGDTDDDGDVDINDVTLLIAHFGGPAIAGGCPWSGARDADFSNNGAVGAEDYAFQVAHWLTTSDCVCAVPSTWMRRVPAYEKPYLRVHDEVSRAADLNQDGWVDHADVRMFETANGLPHGFSDMLHATTPAVR